MANFHSKIGPRWLANNLGKLVEDYMKTLVVTGSSGFVGRKLVQTAIDQGFEVIGLDLIVTESVEYQQHIVDLNSDDVVNLIPKGSTVIHLASLSTDSQCRENPVSAIDSNLTATTRVLRASKLANAQQFIFASSEWVYPELTTSAGQYEEDQLDLLDLNSLYAISKLVGESIVRTTSEIPYWLLRFGIVFGPRKKPGSAPESLALKVARHEKIEVGSFKTGRCFIYIDDLVAGILAAVTAGPANATPTPINIAGSELISLKKVIDISGELLSTSTNCSQGDKLPSIRNPDISLAKQVLGWEPKTSFKDGLLNCLTYMQNS